MPIPPDTPRFSKSGYRSEGGKTQNVPFQDLGQIHGIQECFDGYFPSTGMPVALLETPPTSK